MKKFRSLIGTVGNAIGLPEVVGFALPGKAETVPAWQIYKVTFDPSGRPLKIEFAQALGLESANFVHKWSDAQSGSLTFGAL